MEFCVFTEPQQGFSYDEQRIHAQTTEKLGFDGWFRSDHYMRMGSGSPLPGPTDAWTTLAGLAVQTSRIRLGTLVSSVTYRAPGVLAIQVAQVDAMSGGRAELGLGTGWFEAEHKAYGIPFPSKRFGMLEEQLELITGLWAATEPYSFTGSHYELVDSPALPKPLQDRVPVIVGGGGVKRTPALAARFATEFNIGFVAEDVIAEKFAGVRAACEAQDRDPATLKLSVALPTLVGESEDALSRRAAAIGNDPASPRGDDVIAGTPDEVVEKVARLRALGAQRVYFQLPDQRDLEHLELLGSLLPQLRAL
ncbi:TIGR03560 family F420-dependent LLM class oxidoreductase [Microbacterium horticulturae]|uniref:TIGR03560 family F420-dependent LLM class oxidoreductase n=1 Tax=Microbacterium horticulturae TaxID=3028316 RepID=A0ABY8BZI7_9MICO|nr:TIGR03560 family F420-dependent LLM class oxidoreductase [Microbacterium sp. KACC 23027]WEG09611.1 TIGR03560 family F420-dependent LLM class oxidoreductase [Microbacterium sp. KACC 23027]